MKIDFTKDQGMAIRTRGSDLLVSASAGSGKTTVMVERIASMIANGECEFADLLVLTFTNASAADMRIKLRRRLEVLGVKTENLTEATIGTFHKFCSEVVRTYFNIAEVSPDFSVMDEVSATSLKQEVLGEVITSNYEKCNEAIETFCVNRKTEMFRDTLIEVSGFLASRGDAEAWLGGTAVAAYETDIALKFILDYYKRAGEYYLPKFDDEECKEIAKKLASVRSYEDLHSIALTAEFVRLRKGADEEYKELRNKFKDVIKKVKDQYSLPWKAMEANGRRDREIIRQVIHLVREFEIAYSNAKLTANKLDFNDLEKYMCVVLQDAQIAGALRAKYKYIFIDEYQDTNPMQEKILAAVAGKQNIFMVGDVKQSIYGFRGCEATIFAGKMTDFEKNLSGKVVLLNENFRSKANILKFANSVFGNVMRQETSQIDYDATSRFAVVGTGGVVDVTLVNTSKGTVSDLQAVVVAKKVADLIAQGVAPKDIAILSRQRTHFGMLADTLERVGIPVNVAAEQNAGELFEIAILNNMLFAVSNFYNDVPLVLLMQSFVFGFTPNDMAKIKLEGGEDVFYKNLVKTKSPFLDFLDKYHKLSKTHNVVDVLTIFLTEYKIIERLLLLPQGKRMVGNIHAYLNKLRGASYSATVSEFLYLLENELVEIKITLPTTSDAVQITTMHSSKGLEFPNVIIFDAGAQFNTSDDKRLMVVDKVCGLCVYTLDSDEFTKTMSIARLGATISARRVMIAEEMRLLYVAMTRAKERLFIIGGANVDRIATGHEDYDILCAKSNLNFLAPTLWGGSRDCFDLTVVDAKDVTVEEKKVGTRVLVGVKGKLSKDLRQMYAKPYPHKQAKLKNSVSSLTQIEEEDRVKGRGDAGTQFGTQFHKQMQHIDVGELEKLIPEIKGYKVYRELVFLQSVGDIIVQGVIDLLAVKDGHAVIVDYKTTRASAEKLVELYKPQLDMYADAVRQALVPKTISIYIYSTFNKKLVKV